MPKVVDFKRPTAMEVAYPTAKILMDRPPNLPKHLTDEEIVDAVRMFMQGAKPCDVAAKLEVPERTLGYWTKSKEWRRIRNTLFDEVRADTISTVTRISSLTLTELEDRIVHGDVRCTPEGTIYRVPVNAKTLGDIAVKLMERAYQESRILSGRADQQDEDVKKLADRLLAMTQPVEVQGTHETFDVEAAVEADVIPSEDE